MVEVEHLILLAGHKHFGENGTITSRQQDQNQAACAMQQRPCMHDCNINSAHSSPNSSLPFWHSLPPSKSKVSQQRGGIQTILTLSTGRQRSGKEQKNAISSPLTSPTPSASPTDQHVPPSSHSRRCSRLPVPANAPKPRPLPASQNRADSLQAAPTGTRHRLSWKARVPLGGVWSLDLPRAAGRRPSPLPRKRRLGDRSLKLIFFAWRSNDDEAVRAWRDNTGTIRHVSQR